MLLFPVHWLTRETERSFEIVVYCKTEDAQAVCCRITFPLFFYVGIPQTWSDSQKKTFKNVCVAEKHCVPRLTDYVVRKNIYGFTDNKEISVLRVVFHTLRQMRFFKKEMSSKYQTFEGGVDPILKFLHVRNVQPAGWMEVEGGSNVPESQRISVCDTEIVVDFKQVSPASVDMVPPLVLASFDIECYSSTGGFPVADNEYDAIKVICTCFQRFGEQEPYLKHAIALGPCASIDGVHVEVVHDEIALIEQWFRVLREQSADMIFSWNGFGFDYKYIYNRAMMLVNQFSGESLVDMALMGKAVEGGGQSVIKKLASNAFGDNTYFWLSADGMLHMDLLQIVRKEKKLDKYSLNFVSQTFLGDQKVDLPPAQIFEKCASGDPNDMAEVVGYCIQDTLLPLKLSNRLTILHNLLEMANAVMVPTEYLTTRGMQIRVFSLILRKSRELNFICPDLPKKEDDDTGFQGATVLDPVVGSYLGDDEIVSCFDFASLYPSIIRAENLCFSTLVMDEMYDNMPGVEYYTCETPQGTYKFAQKVPSVLPALLDDLSLYRKKAKKLMAEHRGTEKEKVYNGQQLAYKIAMNSCYGFLGSVHGYLGCLPIATTVTTTGRNMIETTKQCVLRLNPGSRVIYGDTDSVLAILNPNEPTSMASHFELAEGLADIISKEFKPPHCLEFEKSYSPYLLFKKKRYAGMMYTQPSKPDKLDCKGLQLVRRDSCPYVRRVSEDILECIMSTKDKERAWTIAKAYVLKLLRAEEPMDSFVVSKALKSTYKNPDSQPHLQVALKIGERRGYPVPSNERVPFIVVENEKVPDGLIASRAEDPEYAKEHGLLMDRLHYLDSQMNGPLETLLNILEPTYMQRLYADPEVQPLMEHLKTTRKKWTVEAKRKRTNEANRQREISSFFFAVKK